MVDLIVFFFKVSTYNSPNGIWPRDVQYVFPSAFELGSLVSNSVEFPPVCVEIPEGLSPLSPCQNSTGRRN